MAKRTKNVSYKVVKGDNMHLAVDIDGVTYTPLRKISAYGTPKMKKTAEDYL